MSLHTGFTKYALVFAKNICKFLSALKTRSSNNHCIKKSKHTSRTPRALLHTHTSCVRRIREVLMGNLYTLRATSELTHYDLKKDVERAESRDLYQL